MERGLWLLQLEHASAPSCSSGVGGIIYIWPVYTWRDSVGVLQVPGSLLRATVLACRLAKLSGCSSPNYLQLPQVSAHSLLWLRRVLDSNYQTVPQDRCLDTMATGNSPPGLTGQGLIFKSTHRSHGMLWRNM